jgi:hypothetical protein
MRDTMGEVTTRLVDLTALPLAELPSSNDPVLLQSIELIAGHTERSRTGVLQNQAPDEY